MTHAQQQRHVVNMEIYTAVRDIEMPEEACGILEKLAVKHKMKYKTLRQRLYDTERAQGRKCAWRRLNGLKVPDYAKKGVCLICKRATGKLVPEYEDTHCPACNDTGFYIKEIMKPKHQTTPMSIRRSLMEGCETYDEYTLKCRRIGTQPLKFKTFNRHLEKEA